MTIDNGKVIVKIIIIISLNNYLNCPNQTLPTFMYIQIGNDDDLPSSSTSAHLPPSYHKKKLSLVIH